MDILYTLKNCSNCDELTYSLRSLVNLPHDRVFIVGGCPNNINKSKVIHIKTEQNSTKWKNSTENVKKACADARLSDDFILMNDDFFILRQVANPVQEFNIAWDTMQKLYDSSLARGAACANWYKGMKETKDLLQKQGISDPLCYDLHTPFVFNKAKFLKIFDIAGINDIDVLHWRSVYGNLYLKDTQFIEDVKVRTANDFKQDSKFISCSDSGFGIIKPILNKLFPNKSEYEL